jgi:serine/threonine protein kinase
MQTNDPDQTQLFPVETIGRYRVSGFLKRGGMGAVYRAADPELGREVAIKVLPAEFTQDPERVNRFEREIRSLGQLDHPNIVRVYDVGRAGKTLFLVMELANSGSAQELKPLPWFAATKLVADACRGLGAAHAAGMIHRDIKPGNLLIAADGSAKLADFGLVRLGDSTSLTTSHAIVGTPHYMSPEQCRSEPLDERSDIYSLGATYFAILTGQPPYQGNDAMEVMFAHCSKEVPELRSLCPQIPEACQLIIKKAMSKSPADRFTSSAEMLAALESLHQSSEISALVPPTSASVPRRMKWLLAGLIPAGLLMWVFFGVFYRNWLPSPQPSGTESTRKLNDSTLGQSTLVDAGGDVTAIAFHPSGSHHFAWGTESGIVVDAIDGTESFRCQRNGKVTSLIFAMGGHQGQAAFAHDGMIAWDASSGRELYTKDPASIGGSVTAFVNWKSNVLIAGLADPTGQRGGFKTWFNSDKDSFQANLDSRSDAVWSLAVSGEFLLAGCDMGKVQVWIPNQSDLPQKDQATGLNKVIHLAGLPGSRFAASDGARLEVWIIGEREPEFIPIPTGAIGAIAVSPDGKFLAAGEGSAVRIWSVPDRRLRMDIAEHHGLIGSMAFSPDGSMLVSGSVDGKLRLWNRSCWKSSEP